MSILMFALAKLLLVVAVVEHSRVVGIVRGRDAKLGEFPSTVSIQLSIDHPLCSGTLLQSSKTNKTYVVTAAHCLVNKKPNEILVVSGDLSTFQKNSTTVTERQVRHVERIVIHPEYNEKKFANDLAILLLKTPFNLTLTTKLSTLASQQYQDSANCSVAGWGSIKGIVSTTSEYPKSLQYTWTEIVPRNAKHVCYAGRDDGFLIAHDRLGASGPWFGDDGTGLMCNNTLTGVYSFPLDCKPIIGKEFFIGHYTDVHRHRQWIEKSASIMHEPKLFLVWAAILTYFMRFVL